VSIHHSKKPLAGHSLVNNNKWYNRSKTLAAALIPTRCKIRLFTSANMPLCNTRKVCNKRLMVEIDWLCEQASNKSNYLELTARRFSTPSPGVNIPTLLYNTPCLPLVVPHYRPHCALNVAFTLLSWSMTRHDTRGLPRTDPRPELDTPSYQENTLLTACFHFYRAMH